MYKIPMHKHIAIAALISLGLLTACNGSASNDGSSAATDSSSSTQSALESAWTKARAGENPTRDCTVVKARTISSDDPAVAKAAAECNYDIPVAYFNAMLDDVEAGTDTCKTFRTSFMTQLSAMTMSLGGLKQAANKSRNGAADTSAASEAITGALTGDASKSAKDRVKAAMAERASAACPVMTMYFNH